MSDKYFTVNIRAYLDKDEPTYIGEESLYDLLSDFSCPKNPDVEYFLLHNAIEFTKKVCAVCMQQIAWDEMPCSVPVNPSPSSVVALILT